MQPAKVEEKPANLSGITLGDTLIIQYDDGLDQLLMIEWDSSNVPITFDSFFFLSHINCHAVIWYDIVGKLILLILTVKLGN